MIRENLVVRSKADRSQISTTHDITIRSLMTKARTTGNISNFWQSSKQWQWALNTDSSCH